MDPLKKSKVVTGVCGLCTLALLGTSVIAFAKSPTSDANTDDGNTVEVQLDQEVYDGVMGMLHYYSDYEKNGGQSSSNNADQFIQRDGKLYVVIHGTAYHVVETEDGLVVDESGIEDPTDLIGTFDANGNEIIDVTEDGLPIIGYDDLGNAIIGEPKDDVPIEQVLDIDNPQIIQGPDGRYYYHIVWGDTLCKISSELHFSVDELAEYNHIRNVNLIYAESDLRIPTEGWTDADNE